MTIDMWLRFGYAALGFVFAAIPLISSLIAIIKKRCKLKKALANATDEASKAELITKNAEAKNELKEYTERLITEAEKLYKDVDAMLKTQGKSAGLVKKDSVMSKLQVKASELNYAFDYDEWSNYVDDVVAMTKIVNAK